MRPREAPAPRTAAGLRGFNSRKLKMDLTTVGLTFMAPKTVLGSRPPASPARRFRYGTAPIMNEIQSGPISRRSKAAGVAIETSRSGATSGTNGCESCQGVSE